MNMRTLRRMSPAARGAFLVLALSLAGAGPLRAQLVLATAVRNLAFGSVLPGVTNTVQPTDVARSGEFTITGPSLARVEITFTLPTALSASGGATMPISFGPISAGYSASGTINTQTSFNPGTPHRVNLSALGRGSVFVGGALAPPVTQTAGSYSASLTMTVALVGL